MKKDFIFYRENKANKTTVNLFCLLSLSILRLITKIDLVTNYEEKNTLISRKVLVEKL